MKKKAMLVVLLCVMGLTALSIGNAEAVVVYVYNLTSWDQLEVLCGHPIGCGCA